MLKLPLREKMPCDRLSSSYLHLVERISGPNRLDIMHSLSSRLIMSNGFRKSDNLHSGDLFFSWGWSMHHLPQRIKMS
jgi:hypothetical protein